MGRLYLPRRDSPEAQERIESGLPENPYHPNPLREYDHQITEAGRIGYAEAQQDMLKAGFRKLPKDKPPLLKQNLARDTIGNMKEQREADIKHYEQMPTASL